MEQLIQFVSVRKLCELCACQPAGFKTFGVSWETKDLNLLLLYCTPEQHDLHSFILPPFHNPPVMVFLDHFDSALTWDQTGATLARTKRHNFYPVVEIYFN